MAGANYERLREVFKKEVSRRELLLLVAGFGAGIAFPHLAKGSNGPLQDAGTSTAQAAPELKNRVYLPLVTKEFPSDTKNIKGLCYSPYRDGQNPDWGPYPSESDIKEDIGILDPVASYVRTYGADHNLENIPRFILEMASNIKVNAGCWLGSDLQVNDSQIKNLILEANRFPNIASITVGNETQQFGTIPEDRLIGYINYVKQQVPENVTVTTGDTWFAWAQHPRLAEEVDYVFAHLFPYWEPNPIPIEEAVNFIKSKHALLQSLYPRKIIVIGEAGWPSDGPARGSAVPSLENQRRFINEFLTWVNTDKVDFYLFEAFDESWKVKYEGEVGRHWGIYNSDRTPKHPGLTLK